MQTHKNHSRALNDKYKMLKELKETKKGKWCIYDMDNILVPIHISKLPWEYLLVAWFRTLDTIHDDLLSNSYFESQS